MAKNVGYMMILSDGLSRLEELWRTCSMYSPVGLFRSGVGRSHRGLRSRRASENSRRRRRECGARFLGSLLYQFWHGHERFALNFAGRDWESFSLTLQTVCSLSVPHARRSQCSPDRHPMGHGVCAELENADEDALLYLARALSYLATWGLSVVRITVKNQWYASLRTWRIVDEAIQRFSPAFGFALMVHRSVDVPSWEMLPYVCLDEACKQMLPKTTAAGLIMRCYDQRCRLHGSERSRLQTLGTLLDLLKVLPAWTCPVKHWEITLQTALKESIGALSEGTHRVCGEISRVFALSTAVRPGEGKVHIDFCAKDLGKLRLGSVEGASSVCISYTLFSLSHRSQLLGVHFVYRA